MTRVRLAAPSILHDPEQVAFLRAHFLRRAAEAREDPIKFFEFVMRESTTRKPIKASPHQRVLFDFVMHHDRAVIMLPVGTSKTFCTEALSLFFLGRDPTVRGAIVSATQEQAKKVLGVVSDYIGQPRKQAADESHFMGSHELRAVFNLRPSRRERDPWTQVAITVDRPAGIPDASLYAYGMDGAIAGARLSWIVVDDFLNRANTATKEQRDKAYEWLDSSVLSRLDAKRSRIIVTNTAWHPDDLVHRLEKAGWPTLRMDILGNIQVQDDIDWVRDGKPAWESKELRPASRSSDETNYRLRAHDPDPNNECPLWPERFFYDAREPATSWEQAVAAAQADIVVRRSTHLAAEFNRLFLNQCRDDETSMCKQEFIDIALRKARELSSPATSLVSRYTGSNLVFGGLDLAVSPGEEHDDTAFFIFELLPDGTRLILDIDIGQWDGPSILNKLFDKVERYKIAAIRVENNACFAPGTCVLTRERGYVPIEEVRVGEHVWTHRARWRPVTVVIEGTAKVLTSVVVDQDRAFRATPNHLFWMCESDGLNPIGEPQWVSVGFAQKPACVAISRPEKPVIEWKYLHEGPGTWSEYNGLVFNLVVEEDESYTVEDVIVHNAQDYIRQFALDRDRSVPVKAHTTGRAKAHPEHGVPGIFLEMANGAWALPNKNGRVQKPVQQFIDACLYYQPSKHTDDILMSCYFAREMAKEWGVLRSHKVKAGSPSLSLLSR